MKYFTLFLILCLANASDECGSMKHGCNDCQKCGEEGQETEICQCCDVGYLDTETGLNYGNCLGCAPGYGYNSDKDKCKPCDAENCIKCSEYHEICEKCIEGYDVDKKGEEKNKCVKCAVENCDDCDSDDDLKTCRENGCRAVFELSKDRKSCTRICSIENCDICSTVNTCAVCMKGFELSADYTKCEKIICNDENCDICYSSDSCETCKEGFEYVDNLKFHYLVKLVTKILKENVSIKNKLLLVTM